MKIAEHPRHKPFPPGLDIDQKCYYLASGQVSVGKFTRLTPDSLVDFYLPRIRGKNFLLNSRKYKHPGYRTADQAYCAGTILQDRFRMKS